MSHGVSTGQVALTCIGDAALLRSADGTLFAAVYPVAQGSAGGVMSHFANGERLVGVKDADDILLVARVDPLPMDVDLPAYPVSGLRESTDQHQ